MTQSSDHQWVEDTFLRIQLPAAVLEAIVDEAVRRVLMPQRPAARWLYGAKAAAEYLGWPVARVHRNLRRLPHARDGRRLVFHTEQLDRYLEQSYEGPAGLDPSLASDNRARGGGDPTR